MRALVGARPQARSWCWLCDQANENSTHTPEGLKYKKHTPWPNANGLWITDLLWICIPPLTSRNPYPRGRQSRESGVGRAERWTRIRDEALFGSVTESQRGGRSPNPHLRRGTTASLLSDQKAAVTAWKQWMCPMCYSSAKPRFPQTGQAAHTKSTWHCSGAKVASKKGGHRHRHRHRHRLGRGDRLHTELPERCGMNSSQTRTAEYTEGLRSQRTSAGVWPDSVPSKKTYLGARLGR